LKSYLNRVQTLFVVGILFCPTVNAESGEPALHPAFDQKWRVWLGGFFPNFDTAVRVDSNMGSPGDGLDLESVLGLSDKKSTLWGGARWRVNRRNSLEIEFNNLRRSGSNLQTLEDYQIGDYIIEANGEIDTIFNVTLARITYGYSMIRNQRHNFSVKGGFHLARVDLSMDLTGDISDADTGDNLCTPSPCDVTLLDEVDFTFPLPHLGLAYGFAITPKFAFRTQALGFYVEISDIKGVLTEIDLDLQYQPWKHFGFGTGLRYFNITIDDKGDDLIRGRLEYEYYGPVLYVMGSF
jgi:hypothetical protein